MCVEVAELYSEAHRHLTLAACSIHNLKTHFFCLVGLLDRLAKIMGCQSSFKLMIPL